MMIVQACLLIGIREHPSPRKYEKIAGIQRTSA